MTLIFVNSIYSQTSTTNGSLNGKLDVSGVKDARDAVVFLVKVDGVFKPPAKKPSVDQKNLIFIPHVLPVLAGTTVKFPNNDNVMHNVFSPAKVKKFNLGTYGGGTEREVTFEKPGIIPLLCNVHAEMSAYVIVLQNPYFAKTGPDGKFSIKNIPPGTYTIKTWHEKLKAQEKKITISKGKSSTTNFTLTR